MNYDVIIIGAGPGGIFSAYELTHRAPALRVAVFESGHPLSRRRCPIDGDKIKTCIGCPTCSIMSGFGGAGAFSDGKYNITNDFGGTLYEYIGKKQALELMRYVDEINLAHGGEGTKLYSTAGTRFKTVCIQNDLHLLDASVRHLGTDINYKVLQNIYEELKDKVTFFFDTPVTAVAAVDDGYCIPILEHETVIGLPKVRHLSRAQRQQVDGSRLPGAQYPHPLQPRGSGRAGGTARGGLCPPYR